MSTDYCSGCCAFIGLVLAASEGLKFTTSSYYFGSVSFGLHRMLTDRRKALFDALTRPQTMNLFPTYLRFGIDPPLGYLIRMSRHQKTTDPRDKIFSLLSLLSKDHPCSNLVVIDYSISTCRSYTVFAKGHIQKLGCLDILGFVGSN